MEKYNTQKEVWKDVDETNGFYQVSSFGRVRSVDRVLSNRAKRKGKMLKPAKSSSGYYFVGLSIRGKIKNHFVHRLVAEAYLNNTVEKNEVDHVDGNKLNNAVENLEWVSRKENVIRSWQNGLMENQRLSASMQGRRRAKKVRKIDLNGNLIKVYKSQTEAADDNKIKACMISMCCTGARKSAGGYKWEYA